MPLLIFLADAAGVSGAACSGARRGAGVAPPAHVIEPAGARLRSARCRSWSAWLWFLLAYMGSRQTKYLVLGGRARRRVLQLYRLMGTDADLSSAIDLDRVASTPTAGPRPIVVSGHRRSCCRCSLCSVAVDAPGDTARRPSAGTRCRWNGIQARATFRLAKVRAAAPTYCEPTSIRRAVCARRTEHDDVDRPRSGFVLLPVALFLAARCCSKLLRRRDLDSSAA